MNTEIALLPVPADTLVTDKTKTVKIPRKYKTVFLVFFALYFISTLLGAALVPGRLDIEYASFALSIVGNGASLFCAERCFFALFLYFAGFSFLRYPVPLLFLMSEGVFTGIGIKLLMYKFGVFPSLAFAFLTACLVLLDVSVFSFCFSNSASGNGKIIFFGNIAVYLLYFALSLLFSFLITLLF